MNESEGEGDDPAPTDVGSHHVLERHIQDRSCDHRLHERREPKPTRGKPVRGCDQRDGVGHRERGDDREQSVELSERDDQTEKEKQVIDSVQDVEEAGLHEAKGRLVPPRIERDESRVTDKLECTHDTARRHEAKHHLDPRRQSLEPGPDRELRVLRLNRILEKHVEHRLLPYQIDVVRQPGCEDMPQGRVILPERLIRRNRDPDGGDFGGRKPGALFEQLQRLGDPHLRTFFELRIRFIDFQIPWAARWEIDVLHRSQWHTEEESKCLSLGLEERLDRHVGGGIVGRSAHRERHEQRPDHDDGGRQADDSTLTSEHWRPLPSDCGGGFFS